MSETTTVSAADIVCNLKAVVADLECQQKQQLFKQLQKQLEQERQIQKRQQQQEEQKNKSSAQPPMFIMIPIEDTQKCEGGKKSRTGHDHDNSSSKGSTRGNEKNRNGSSKKTHHGADPALELKGAKSRELRAGILYTGCGCMHRDGLQDSCPRSECQGQPACLTKPWACCPPGMMCRSRHQESFGAPPNPDAVTF